MKVYLASRYSRIEEMNQVAKYLGVLGHVVTSRWIEGNHRIAENTSADMAAELNRQFAQDDLLDVLAADTVLMFTPGGTRGGLHVECGYAMAFNRQVVVIGPRESVFHYLLPQFDTFDAFLTAFASGAKVQGYVSSLGAEVHAKRNHRVDAELTPNGNGLLFEMARDAQPNAGAAVRAIAGR